MRVLGVDPGLRITGYAVVEMAGGEPALLEAGVLRAPRQLPELAGRLRAIYADLCEVMAEFQPSVLGLESLYSEYRFPRSALQMAHVRGVICLAAAQEQVPVVDISPREVKNAVVGAGGASKQQVQRTVQTLYRLEKPPSPPDVADAIAIATAVAYRVARQSE
ncbi:MAG: crossover junction endodeoxyribonuclease RuvC [Armatimonadetes bacterium]|nr:crossover junction endodeoxyribonuclease RuvC [Armatimonadota bacterium]